MNNPTSPKSLEQHRHGRMLFMNVISDRAGFLRYSVDAVMRSAQATNSDAIRQADTEDIRAFTTAQVAETAVSSAVESVPAESSALDASLLQTAEDNVAYLDAITSDITQDPEQVPATGALASVTDLDAYRRERAQRVEEAEQVTQNAFATQAGPANVAMREAS